MVVDRVRDGKADARSDWRNQTAKYYTIGLLDDSGPQLREARPFYRVSTGCDVDESMETYCIDYNQELERLVRENGIPEWAPFRRAPDRATSLLLLRNEGIPANLGLGDERLSSVRWLTSRRSSEGIDTVLVAFSQERRVALLGGDRGPRAGVVDIADIEGGYFMCRHEFRRRHQPVFPWDGD